MIDDERRLDGAGILELRSLSQCVDFLVFRRRFSGRWIEPDELDAGPEATEDQPLAAIAIEHKIRVDRVVIIRTIGLDDLAFVAPSIVRGRSIERRVRRESDNRAVRAEGRDGIIEPVAAVHL